jgi:hypothetical protein
MADATSTQNINYGFAKEAAPFATDLLGQAQALTDINANPYQQYQGDTLAQFTPLQNLAFGNAATMSSAPQLQDASALAGMAGLGALNTNYTFQPSNFTQENYKQMVNPFLDVQNAATYRQNAIQQAANNAQATTAGAFGGGRQAIMNAQANADLQRNLGQNQFNAYNQAQQQYNTQQQQNAQQQQFGAGLGLQGLQTANQAASNLANIGQTQYGQNMGINQLQAQYGGAQQQQVQNALNQQQQQFLNYQNYPYQQLNFMQNMIRGLPMTNQTASVYQSPGSILGQVAGLGIGAAAALNKKEGGSISSYKEGGEVKKFDEGGDITDPSEGKLHQMMGSLSDQQLQQILQHPTSMAEAEAAQVEMAYRQSVHNGMRSGGAVAFAGGGNEGLGVYSGGDIAPPISEPGMGIGKALNLPFSNLSQFADFLNPNEPKWKKEERLKNNGIREAEKVQKENMSEYKTRRGDKAEDYKEAWKKPEAAVKEVIKNAPTFDEARKAAANMGVGSDEWKTIYDQVYGRLSKGDEDIIKSLKDLTAEQTGEAKNIKAEGDRKALMNFGFNLAAESARPGVAGNKGFAGLLRSAAAASPSYAASLADTDKLARESQRLANQMQVEMVKYQAALKKGNETAAMGHVHNIMSTRIQQQQVEEAKRHNIANEQNQAAHTGMLAEHYKAAGNNNAFKLAGLKARAMEMGKKQAESDYKNDLSLMTNKNMTPGKLAQQYAKQNYSELLRSMASPAPFPLEE